ncbi:MAG: hypothetical protein KIT69_08055 [Propionibacteriaceae bacterium]|nr:hypothetical protein [Propionibacteriaceae bacterium]
MKFTRPLALGIAAGLVIGAFGAAATASAEPVTDGYALTGSDTLQDSLNAITNGTRVTGSSVRATDLEGVTLGNYDAFGTGQIQVKPNGPYFKRPAGSGDGRNALIASIQGESGNWDGKVITGQVDIARSSSGPGSSADDNGDLAYVPYARDAISYAYVGPDANLGDLSVAQLKEIYESSAANPVVIGGTTILPLIPQSSSGTRSTFLLAIGVSTLGSGVSSTYGGVANSLPENDGSVLTQVGHIVPFSAGSWIAQANKVAGVNTIPSTGTVKMGKIAGVAPFTTSGTTLVPNQTFYNGAFGRDTYLIVEWARINPNDAKYDPSLAALMNPSSTASLVNMSASATSVGGVKRRFGFLPVADSAPIRAYPNVY